MKNYAIAFYDHTSLGVTLKFLKSISQWDAATNLTFNSVNHAVQYAKTYRIVEDRPSLGYKSMPFVIGPRGGIYSIFSGKRKR